MNHLQEKFQITVPAKEEAGEGWTSFESSRSLNGQRATEDKFNHLPPGMELSQWASEQNPMLLSMSGASDVSRDTNPTAFANGFTRKEMKGSDDQYSGEHVDHFYGDTGGFVERNNYLDRM